MESMHTDFYDIQTSTEKEMLSQAKSIYDKTGYYFYLGILAVKKGKLWGFINDNGEVVIDFQFINQPIFEADGYARAYRDRHKCGLIDYKGNVIIDFKYDNVFSYAEDGFARIEKGIYWGTLDREGNEHIKPKMKFQEIKTFHDGIAPAKIETKWGLIDTEGNHISAFKYYDIQEEKNGLFYTRINTKTDGYLNRKGELVDKDKTEQSTNNNTIKVLNKYCLAYNFIPYMIDLIGKNESYKLSYLADLEFFKFCAEHTNSQNAGFKWEDILIDVVKFRDGRSAITYQFPKPEKEPGAVRGAIVFTDGGYYYITLELCQHPGRYMLAFTSSNEHVPLGLFDIEPTKDNFMYMIDHALPFIMKGITQHVFNMPEGYQKLKDLQDDPDNCINIGKQTSRANCFVQYFPIPFESSLPYEKESVIKEIYETIPDYQSVIEVNNGFTSKGYRYVYIITKIMLKPHGVKYTLILNIYYGKVSLCIQGEFEEIGMTGERDAFIFELMQREGEVTMNGDKIEGWFYDPFEENKTHSCKMNLCEQPQFDKTFPDHPLSQCRELIRITVENQ